VFLIVLGPIAITFAVVMTQRDHIIEGGAGDQKRRPEASRSGHLRLALLGLGVAISAGAMQWASDRLVPVHALPIALAGLGLVGVALTAPRLVPPGTLRMSRGLPAVMMSRFLLTSAFNGSMTFIPLMLVNERHLSLTTAGITLTVGALGWSFGSFLQGSRRMLNRRSELVVAGGAALMIGILLLASIAGFGWHYYLVGLATATSGLGMGLAMSSTSVLSLALSPVADHGSSSSSLQLSDVLGSAMGISAAGAVFAALHNPSGSDAGVFELIWVCLAALAALVMVGGQQTRT
jgi:hypothetical protein